MSQLSYGVAVEIQAALDAYATELARIAKRYRNPAAAEAAVQAVREGSAALRRRLQRVVDKRRGVAFDAILEAQLAVALVSAKNVGLLVQAPSITMLGQFEALGAAGNWKTLLRNHGFAAEAEATHIIRQAILRQADPSRLARALRPYVIGSEPFHKAFGPLALDGINLRELQATDPLMRGAARRMNFNARRIAFSEIHNARQEADLTAFAVDPLVYAVAWRLSTFRGPTAQPDECDVLAKTDFYGLGPGVFPLSAVPIAPHPFDKCERVPMVMTRSQFKEGKPRVFSAPLKRNPQEIRLPAGVPRHARDRVRRHATRAILDTQVQTAGAQLSSIAVSSTTVELG